MASGTTSHILSADGAVGSRTTYRRKRALHVDIPRRRYESIIGLKRLAGGRLQELVVVFISNPFIAALNMDLGTALLRQKLSSLVDR